MQHGPQFELLAQQLRAGDDGAAGKVFTQFTHRLIALARTRLDPLIRTKVDPEDVVQSVFRSFFCRHADGQFQLDDWDGLWAILAIITIRKCRNKQNHFRSSRRDIAREVAFPHDRNDIAEAISGDPAPEQAVILVETLETLMRRLNGRQRQVLSRYLQGHSVPEISLELQRTERTIRRVLQHVREELETMHAADG